MMAAQNMQRQAGPIPPVTPAKAQAAQTQLPDAPIDMPVQRLELPRNPRRLWLRLRLALLARAGL